MESLVLHIVTFFIYIFIMSNTNTGSGSGSGNGTMIPDLTKVKPVTEERRLELLALARSSRITWILEGIDKGSVTVKNSNNSKPHSITNTNTNIPISNILQHSFNYFTDVIGDKEYIHIDSLIPLASLDEFDVDMNMSLNQDEEQYIQYIDDTDPYCVFLNQLCQLSTSNIVKTMQQYILKCKTQISINISHSVIANRNNKSSTSTSTSNLSPISAPAVQTFLNQIYSQMSSNPMWKIKMIVDANANANGSSGVVDNQSKQQFECIKEHGEKFVHMKLYSLIRNSVDNITRDKQLLDKILTLNFITSEHLDIKSNPNPNQSWDKLLETPNQYLLQLSHRQCPNGKMECIKLWMAAVTRIIQQVASETSLHQHQTPPGADDYLSLLILSVQKCCQLACKETKSNANANANANSNKYEDFLHLYSTQMYLQS